MPDGRPFMERQLPLGCYSDQWYAHFEETGVPDVSDLKHLWQSSPTLGPAQGSNEFRGITQNNPDSAYQSRSLQLFASNT
jgi:hypothetical protein